MDTVAKRLKIAMHLRNMRQVDIVQATGINKGSLSSYISGKYLPKQANIHLLSKALNIDEQWLLGQDVPMKSFGKCYEEDQDVSEEEQFLNYYRALNKIGKQEAFKRLQELTLLDQYVRQH